MSRVDRRPTVVRNFTGGDRRSVEWALEQWLAVDPPVEGVVLRGDGASVAATAAGLREVLRLRGLDAMPWEVVAELPDDGAPCPSPGHALAAACGASTATWRDLRAGDVLAWARGGRVDAAMDRRVAEGPHPCVALVTPGARVPAAWAGARAAGRLRVVPSTHRCGTLCPSWEAAVEDAAPSRLVVLGDGDGVFEACIAAGDFFLERADGVPGRAEAAALLRARVAVLADAVAPPSPWRTARDAWEDACRRAGARVREGAGPREAGVVVEPVQRGERAA